MTSENEKSGAAKLEISREEAENIFYEFLERNFEIGRDDVERNEQKVEFAQKIIVGIINKRFIFADDSVVYKLKFPVGSISEITLKTRIKIGKTPTSAKDTQMVQVLKVIESYANTPLVILQDLDVFDFTRISALISFFA
ncbi:MAG: hypothetical protein FWF51_08945 [Chitinivibrionia bacterium]|nr:hypothetical protein [Chitinivibrionia bacterium]